MYVQDTGNGAECSWGITPLSLAILVICYMYCIYISIHSFSDAYSGKIHDV